MAAMLLYCGTAVDAQIESFPSYFPHRDFQKLKNIKYTYLVVDNVNSPVAQKYFKALKACWKLSPSVELISYKDIKAKDSPDALFISTYVSVWRYMTAAPQVRLLGFRYWTIRDTASAMPGVLDQDEPLRKALKPNQDIIEYDREVFETSEKVFTAPANMKYSENLNLCIFEMVDRDFFWSEGFFRNRLCLFQRSLDMYSRADTSKKAQEDMLYGFDKKKLEALKKQTLYMPATIFTPRYWGIHSGDGELPDTFPHAHDEKSTMAYYGYKYQLLSTDDLCNKITNDKHGFNYLYVKRYAGGILLEIANSKTGDLIYRQYLDRGAYYTYPWGREHYEWNYDHPWLMRLGTVMK